MVRPTVPGVFSRVASIIRVHALKILAAIAVLLVGGTFRFSHYSSGHGHGDEKITVEVLRYMRESGDWDVNWAKAELPPDLRYDQYNFSSHLYAAFVFYQLVKFVPGTEQWRGQRDGVVVYRFFGAALAAVAMVQAMRLGWLTGGWDVALIATAVTSAAVLLVQDAHYVRPEPLTVVLTLAAITLAWPRETLRPARILGAAFFIGLLVACKISMLLLAWVPLVPLLAKGIVTARRAGWLFGVIPVAMLAGFAMGAPTAIAHPSGFIYGVQHLRKQYAGLHPPFSHLDGSPVADFFGRYCVATLGWPLLGCFIAGIVLLLRRRRWAETFLLVAPVLLFAGYFATRSVFFERNVSHVVPLFAVVAAYGGVELTRFLTTRLRAPAPLVVTGLIVLLTWRSASLSYRLVYLEYGGRANIQKSTFEDAVRVRFPDAEWRAELLVNEGPLNRLKERIALNPRPVLLRVVDFRDDWTATMLGLLKHRFAVKEVAVFPGTFHDVPMCTLLTYHSAMERYFLITAAR